MAAVYEERSQISRKHAIIMLMAFLFLVAVISFTVYKWFFMGIRNHVEAAFELFVLLVILERSLGQFVYRIEGKQIRIEKKGIFGRREYNILFRDIEGITLYQPQLVTLTRYRKTFRLHSAVDGRPVWTLIYKEKDRYVRIFFKPSETMLKLLAEKLPKKVHLPEQE